MSSETLPPNWSWVKLGDTIEKISTTGIKLKQKEYLVKGKYPVIDQGQELVGGYSNNGALIVNTELPIIIFGDHTKVKKFIDFKFIAGADGVIVIKPKKEFYPKLFFYFLHCIQFPDKGYARHFQYVEKADIPLPPLPEQKKIVEKIEELFSGLENGVASLKKAKAQIRLYRQSVLAAAFSGRLHPAAAGKHDSQDLKINRIKTESGKFINPANPEIQINPGSDNLPTGWKWVKLGEIIKVSSGKGLTSANMFNDGLYSVYGGNGVSGYYNEFLFEEPRLIIGRVGAKCGVIHITKPKSWVTDNALIVDFISNNVEMKFLYHCLDYHNLNKLSVSTAQPVISGAKIYPYEIMLPPVTQQTQIVEEIESRFAGSEALEKAIDDSLAKSEILRQSILSQAFSGKLV